MEKVNTQTMPSGTIKSDWASSDSVSTGGSSSGLLNSEKKIEIIDICLDDKKIEASKRRAAKILKLDRDPLTALQKALALPAYLGLGKKIND